VNNPQNSDARTVRHTAAQNLRKEVLNKIVSLLEIMEGVEDSQSRLNGQALCLDIATGLEDVIEQYRLSGITR
jgi:hypothetical protein